VKNFEELSPALQAKLEIVCGDLHNKSIEEVKKIINDKLSAANRVEIPLVERPQVSNRYNMYNPPRLQTQVNEHVAIDMLSFIPPD
jgi:hypothetical protein